VRGVGQREFEAVLDDEDVETRQWPASFSSSGDKVRSAIQNAGIGAD
jgi:hypothetical protein